MRCPFCTNGETQVVETRESDEGDVIRRRRRCLSCDKRFTTYERAEIEHPVIVKKDGRRTEFDPAKLRASMTLALRKRPVSAEALDQALARIETSLLHSGEREVSSTRVGEWVMRELKRLDKVAYIRFASVYRSFDDVSQQRAPRQRLQDLGQAGLHPLALAGSEDHDAEWHLIDRLRAKRADCTGAGSGGRRTALQRELPPGRA